MTRWPKILPPLSPEQQRINDEFMKLWLERLPRRYGHAERFNHGYVVRNAPPGFRRTLEVGAGIGGHLAYETLTAEQAGEYVALELRKNVAAQLHLRAPWVRVVVGDCQRRLEFPDGHFDRILAIHVLEHLPDLPSAVREMHRLCDKTRGALSVVIPCEGGLAYALARRLSAQRLYEARYGIPYKNFIEREHLSVPSEILEELDPWFETVHRSFFPIPLPFVFCNLFMGMTLRPRPAPTGSGEAAGVRGVAPGGAP